MRLRARDVARESWATMLSQSVSSLLTVVVVAAMVAAVILTAGRTNGSEQQVLATFESAGTRTLVIRIEPAAQVALATTARLQDFESVEWVGALGAARDVTNPHLQGGEPVTSRQLLSSDLDAVAPGWRPALPGQALTTPGTAELLGLYDGSGYVAGPGAEATITHLAPLPPAMEWLDPLVMIPVDPGSPEAGDAAALVVVVARNTQDVAVLARTIPAVLDPAGGQGLSVETSGEFSAVQAVVSGQLGAFSRSLVLGVFAILAVLVLALFYGLVMIRRRDFGRRRALGASRSLIVVLLLSGTLALAAIGSLIGLAIGLGALRALGDPLPTATFCLATVTLAILAAILGALAPAWTAARRDPLTELRVP